jgi:hypothetical protein
MFRFASFFVLEINIRYFINIHVNVHVYVIIHAHVHDINIICNNQMALIQNKWMKEWMNDPNDDILSSLVTTVNNDHHCN